MNAEQIASAAYEIPLEDRPRVLELDPTIQPLMAEVGRLFQMDDDRYRDLEPIVQARIVAAHRRLVLRRRWRLEELREWRLRTARRLRRHAIEELAHRVGLTRRRPRR